MKIQKCDYKCASLFLTASKFWEKQSLLKNQTCCCKSTSLLLTASKFCWNESLLMCNRKCASLLLTASKFCQKKVYFIGQGSTAEKLLDLFFWHHEEKKFVEKYFVFWLTDIACQVSSSLDVELITHFHFLTGWKKLE